MSKIISWPIFLIGIEVAKNLKTFFFYIIKFLIFKRVQRFYICVFEGVSQLKLMDVLTITMNSVQLDSIQRDRIIQTIV